MKLTKRQKLLIGLGSLILVLSSVPASASETLMLSMPMGVQSSCISCHNATNPPSGDNLNAFGLDFSDSNGQTWSLELASLDSDGDGCSNGAELGDSDGNGVLDQGVDIHTLSNPGVAGDCSSAGFDEATWSELKSLFNGSR